MNTDKLSSIMGAVVAVMTAIGTFNMPVETPTWQKAIGYAGAACLAVWGYVTNKMPR